MKYWVFIVKQQKTEDGLITAEEILTQRLHDKFWGLGEKTPNRRSLQKGDKIVFYVAYGGSFHLTMKMMSKPMNSIICSSFWWLKIAI